MTDTVIAILCFAVNAAYSINGEWVSSAYFSLGMSQRLSVYYSDIARWSPPILLDYELTMKRTVPEPCSGAGYVASYS